MDLTVESKKVSRRVKGRRQVKKIVKPCPSFFRWFDAPALDECDDEEEYAAMVDSAHMDFDIALAFRNKIVPYALRYYVGDVEDSDDEDYVPEDDEEDDDDESSETDSDDSESDFSGQRDDSNEADDAFDNADDDGDDDEEDDEEGPNPFAASSGFNTNLKWGLDGNQ